METGVVKAYFNWNDALRRFFLTESDYSVKLLCVDDDILDEIGRNYNIEKPVDLAFHEHFRKSVALTNEGRDEMLCFWADEMRCNIPRGGSSLFQIARRLSGIDIPEGTPQRFLLPSLALTVLFILLSDDKQPRQSVIKSLALLTRNLESDERGGFDDIPLLFSAISNYDPNFDNNRRGLRKNVGCLQYQKVLNQREIKLFRQFLYCNHIVLDESISSYEELMNYNILGKLRREYEPLRERIVRNNKFFHEEYFKRQILNFDKEKYEAQILREKTSHKVLGTLYLVIDFSSGRAHFQVYIDVPVGSSVSTSLGEIPIPLEETNNGLYPTRIKCESLDTYSSITCEDEHYEVSVGFGNGGPIYFRESGNYLIQAIVPEPSRGYYVLISSQNRNAIRKLQDQQVAEAVDVGGLFGDGWLFFRVDNWQIRERGQATVKDEFEIGPGPGIAVPGRRDLYFNKGLPSVRIPDGFDYRQISVERDIVVGQRALHRDLCYHNGHVYIDISPQDPLGENMNLPILVKARGENIDAYSVFYPQLNRIAPPNYDHLFTYDGWGRICLNRSTPCLADNCLIHSSITVSNVYNTEPEHLYQTWDDQEKSFRFIELLRASFLESGVLFANEINKIVSYLVGYYGLPPVQNKNEEYGYLTRTLVDLGFLNESFNEKGKHIYQLASPRLFPTGKKKRNCIEYVLYGSFIRDQIIPIYSITPNYNYIRPFSIEAKKKHCYLAFTPYYLIVSLSEDQLDRVKKLGITVEKESLSDRILSMIKSPRDFSNDFLTEANRLFNDNYDSGADYPRVTYLNGRWRLEDGNNMYESYTPDNQRYRRVSIPPALMMQFCRSRASNPVCMIDERRGKMSFLYEMPVPRLMIKCLNYINLGLPERKRVFCLDGSLGDFLLYYLSEYSVSQETQGVIAKLLSGTDTPVMKPYRISSSRYRAYYIKPQAIYDPFQVHLYLRINPSRPYAFAKKRRGVYTVFKRDGDEYYRLDYPSANQALTAVLRDDPDLTSHMDRTDVSADGPLVEDNLIIEKEEITIIE